MVPAPPPLRSALSRVSQRWHDVIATKPLWTDTDLSNKIPWKEREQLLERAGDRPLDMVITAIDHEALCPLMYSMFLGEDNEWYHKERWSTLTVHTADPCFPAWGLDRLVSSREKNMKRLTLLNKPDDDNYDDSDKL